MVVELGIKLSKIALKGLIKDKQQEITEFSSELKEPEKNEEVDNSPNIDWEDLNYPWGIRLVHYNRAELDASCAKISRIAQIAAFLGYSTLLLNFIDVTVLASMGVFPIRILYSFFDIILVAPAICVNFYLSFLALAMKKPLYTRFYMGSQIALCLLYLIFAILGEGPINGFTKFTHIAEESKHASGMCSYYAVI